MFVLFKFLITLVIVLGLSEVAKRVSPTAAGILIGLPLGSALSTYFFTIEQGPDFTLATIPWAMAGLSASLVFSLAYVLAGRWGRIRNRLAAVLFSTFAAFSAFALFSGLLCQFSFGLFSATCFSIAVIAANFLIFRGLKIPRTTGSSASLGIGVVIFRAVVAGLSVTIITGIAKTIGQTWAGILGVFPVMLFPLLLVLHFEEGKRLYPGVVDGFAYSVSNIVVFYLLLDFLLPRLGLNPSFVILYAVSALYLWIVAKVRGRLTAEPAAVK